MRITLLLAVTLSACAPASLGRVPSVSPNVAAQVVVIRPTDSASEDRTLTLDGQAIATLPAGGYTRFPIQPGPHWLGVGCFTGLGLSWTEQHRIVLADPRATYYFLVADDPRCARIEPVSEAAAKDLISQGKYQSIGSPREQS